MKLNNKGFAITAVLYGLLILFVLTAGTYLIALSVKKDRVTSLTDEIENSYYNKETLTRYTVTYNANGGENAPNNQIKLEGISLSLTLAEPTRDGYNFKGWGTSMAAGAASYMPGDTYSNNSAITLYAIWEEQE